MWTLGAVAFLSPSSLSGLYVGWNGSPQTCHVLRMFDQVQAPSNTSAHNNVFRDVTLGLKEIVQRAIPFRERIILVKNRNLNQEFSGCDVLITEPVASSALK